MRVFALVVTSAALIACRTRPLPLRENAEAPAHLIAATSREDWREHERIASHGGEYVLYVAPNPRSFPDNEAFSFSVHVCDSSKGEPLARDVALAVDAAMPQHGHGMNRRPLVQSTPDGGFLVEGMYFHMTGRWELYLDVTRGAWTERAQCTVELADE